MKLGVAYYPEHCEPEQWAVDYEKIKNAGIERIRIAEFSWSCLEPEKGVYNWEWLDKSIDMAEKYGIEVVLCTPTACPPIWLVEEFPDILPVNEEGRRDSFGGRQHRCFNSPKYLEYSYKLVELMAQRYGKHHNVTAWQVDNELGAEQKWCYCDHCNKAFQEFLEEKYISIGRLNKRWGNHFWSQDYQRWNQIKTPQKCANYISVKPHPSLALEFFRFSSGSIVKFCSGQASVIRKYSPGRTVTSNLYNFRWGDNLNWPELVKNLDVAAVDLYSDKIHEIAFYTDFINSLKPGNAWFLEFGPSIENVTEAMDHMQEKGCDWLFFFKLKPFPWGQEQQTRKELLTPTGEFTQSYHKVKKWVEENKKPGISAKRAVFSEVGMYFDFDSSWSYYEASWGINNRQTYYDERLEYQHLLVDIIYPALYREDFALRIVTSKEQLEGLKVLVMPLKIIYESDLELELINFVRNGGKLIVTTDFFKKNQDNVYLDSVPEIYKLLFGSECRDFIYKENEGKNPIVREGSIGEGKVYMIREDAAADEWKQLAEELVY